MFHISLNTTHTHIFDECRFSGNLMFRHCWPASFFFHFTSLYFWPAAAWDDVFQLLALIIFTTSARLPRLISFAVASRRCASTILGKEMIVGASCPPPTPRAFILHTYIFTPASILMIIGRHWFSMSAHAKQLTASRARSHAQHICRPPSPRMFLFAIFWKRVINTLCRRFSMAQMASFLAHFSYTPLLRARLLSLLPRRLLGTRFSLRQGKLW